MNLPKLWRVRKASQRMMPTLDACERCGNTENLQRHHHSYDDPAAFEILCRTCHDKWHAAERLESRMKPCAICGTRFLPDHSKKHKTCSRACLSELGRCNAMKRWGRESTALEPSATPSSRKSRTKSSEQ